MPGFVATSKTYRCDQNCSEASIEDVGPVHRALCVGIFNDSSEEGSARERVIRILHGFRSGQAIPPVQLVQSEAGYSHLYKLTHGVRRFYCSLAAGFTHVPWMQGFDWDAPYE
jgi:hypothetical protein